MYIAVYLFYSNEQLNFVLHDLIDYIEILSIFKPFICINNL